MGIILQLLNLTDRYERKARLLPALIVALPLAIAAGTAGALTADWYSALGFGALIGGVVGVGLAHLARIPGTRLETKLCRKWGGLPTRRWLRPSDTTCSDEQKSRWRGAIRTLTGLTLPATSGTKSEADIDRLIDDAVRQLRHRLRDDPAASFVRTHNEDYGFARNLTGLRWVWLLFSVAGAAVCGFSAYSGHVQPVALAASGILVLIAATSAFTLPGYVRHCADRYAEALLAAAISAADALNRKSKDDSHGKGAGLSN
jgi:hypothetical protein